jgi:hypothetical protein
LGRFTCFVFPRIDKGRLDIALITRLPTQKIEILRRERFVWVASPKHIAWESNPLPVALFEPGCAARMNVLEALGNAGHSYRCTYSSASLLGLIVVVQAGLAVAALAESSVPLTLSRIEESAGLPPLRDLEIGLLRDPVSAIPAAERLESFIRRGLSR